MNIRMFKKGDLILIIFLTVIAVAFLAGNALMPSFGTQLTAVITQDGQTIREIKLTELQNPETIMIQGSFHQVIQAEEGRIRFLESDCPDEICVQMGWLTKPGDKAVCLPSKVVIKIVGDNDQVDSIAY